MNNGITVVMALVDFTPVVLFLIAAIILQKDLYGILVKGAYSLIAGGAIMAFIGGVFKALWKLFFALGICDYVLLDHAFFPMQASGFMLFLIGLSFGLLYRKGTIKNSTNTKALLLAFAVSMMTAFTISSQPVLAAGEVKVISTSLPFIIFQVIGLGGSQFVLAAVALRQKMIKTVIFFLLAFVLMLAMGYLGAKFDDSSGMHWIAQIVNSLSMVFFLLGTIDLHKKGYGLEDCILF